MLITRSRSTSGNRPSGSAELEGRSGRRRRPSGSATAPRLRVPRAPRRSRATAGAAPACPGPAPGPSTGSTRTSAAVVAIAQPPSGRPAVREQAFAPRQAQALTDLGRQRQDALGAVPPRHAGKRKQSHRPGPVRPASHLGNRLDTQVPPLDGGRGSVRSGGQRPPALDEHLRLAQRRAVADRRRRRRPAAASGCARRARGARGRAGRSRSAARCRAGPAPRRRAPAARQTVRSVT